MTRPEPGPRGRVRATLAALALSTSACMAGGGPSPAPGSGAEGSLRQDEITMELVVDQVQVRLTPLDPEILRVTAPDTRRRLSSLVPPGTEGVHFLVAIFTEEPGGAAFEPRAVALENRGRLFRPAGIRGLTPGWGSSRLEQQEAEQAVYTFPPEIDLELPLTVVVGSVRNGEWASILPRIDAERARIGSPGGTRPQARAATAPRGGRTETHQARRPAHAVRQTSSSNFRILR